MRQSSTGRNGARTVDARDPEWGDDPYGAAGDAPYPAGRPGQQGAGRRAGNRVSHRPDPGPGSRRAANARRRKKGKRRVMRWVAAVVSLAILGTAGAAWAYYQHLNGNIRKDALN